MASQVRVPTTGIRGASKENVIDFTAEVVKAPFSLRCGAALIDYIIVFSAPVIFLLIGRSMGEDGAGLLNGQLNNVGWLAAILLAVSNLVLIPAISGRSIGKALAGLAIVSNNGTPTTIGAIFLRQTIGYFLLFATGGLGYFISIFSNKGKALHDFLFGTVVIYAQKSKVAE